MQKGPGWKMGVPVIPDKAAMVVPGGEGGGMGTSGRLPTQGCCVWGRR